MKPLYHCKERQDFRYNILDVTLQEDDRYLALFNEGEHLTYICIRKNKAQPFLWHKYTNIQDYKRSRPIRGYAYNILSKLRPYNSNLTNAYNLNLDAFLYRLCVWARRKQQS